MHSLSPYSVRCFNPAVDGTREEQYSVLDKVGEYDTKQVFRFKDVNCNKKTRVISGYLEAGHYGIKSDIIDINTGAVNFEKAQKNAEILRHFFHIFLPLGLNEGITLFHGYRGIGVKTLFFDGFNGYLKGTTGLSFQMNPLSYDKAIEEWQNAKAKEIRLVGFTGAADLADQISQLGHREMELKLKPPRSGVMGYLKDYFNRNSEQAKAVEILKPFCSEVKTVVDLNGAKRTFTISGNTGATISSIQAPEELELEHGNPIPEAMLKWCSEVTKEFASSIYPNLEVGK